MDRIDYLSQCARLANYLTNHLEAVRVCLSTDPNLTERVEFDRLCQLQDEAAAAGGAWAAYSQTYRSIVDWRQA